MTIIYIIAGIFAGFLLLITGGYMLIAYALIGGETMSLDETQRTKCREAVKAGQARSLTCRLYIREGKCPHRPCPTIGE
jgi:hypothetical protein